MANLVRFESWPEVLAYAKKGGELYYGAPMDRQPIRLTPGNNTPYSYEVRARTIKIWPPGSVGRGRNRTADPFSADSGHLDRFSRPAADVVSERVAARHREPADEHAANELVLYIENTSDLSPDGPRGQGHAVLLNALRKWRKGTYDSTRAVRLFEYLVETGAKRYVTEFGHEPSEWRTMFNPATRHEAARQLEESFRSSAENGEYDHVDTRIGQPRESVARSAPTRVTHGTGRTRSSNGSYKRASREPASVSTYTYTIFDANPNSSSGTAWPSHQDVEIEADSDEDAVAEVRDVMSTEAAGLNPVDGYDVGQLLYAIVWDADEVIVGEPTYELTAADLGVEEERASLPEDAVIVEVMPYSHRSSHRAARNWGVYPHNGSRRIIMSREDAEALVEEDEDEYDHIVRDAAESDLDKYDIEINEGGRS